MPKEAKFSILFRHWIKAHPQKSCSFEIKQTDSDSIPFSKITQAQIDYGKAIKSKKGVLLRTQAVAEGMPDYIYLRNIPANIVIKYPRFFCIIDIDIFDAEKKRSKRRSLTSKRATEIAQKVIHTPYLTLSPHSVS